MSMPNKNPSYRGNHCSKKEVRYVTHGNITHLNYAKPHSLKKRPMPLSILLALLLSLFVFVATAGVLFNAMVHAFLYMSVRANAYDPEGFRFFFALLYDKFANWNVFSRFIIACGNFGIVGDALRIVVYAIAIVVFYFDSKFIHDYTLPILYKWLVLKECRLVFQSSKSKRS